MTGKQLRWRLSLLILAFSGGGTLGFMVQDRLKETDGDFWRALLAAGADFLVGTVVIIAVAWAAVMLMAMIADA